MYNYLLRSSCRITTHQPHANGACDETQLGGDDGGAADRDQSHALCLRMELLARHCPIRPWHSRARAWPALWLSRSCRLAIEPSALPAGAPAADELLGIIAVAREAGTLGDSRRRCWPAASQLEPPRRTRSPSRRRSRRC